MDIRYKKILDTKKNKLHLVDTLIDELKTLCGLDTSIPGWTYKISPNDILECPVCFSKKQQVASFKATDVNIVEPATGVVI